MEGTLGNDISPTARKINSALTTYQSVRLLPLMLFTNLSDVLGIAVNGGEMKQAWEAFVSGMREIRNTWAGELRNDKDWLRAEQWGTVEAASALDSLGQTYNGAWMTGNAKRISDKFFRIIGAEGWNRGIRAAATVAAENSLAEWAKHGVNMKDAATRARVERMYGERFNVKNIKLDNEGRLDINDLANQRAVQRWVEDAIMSPNAAIRPTPASDPHYATFYYLKNFAYTMHRVLLHGVVNQARLGNYRPALILGTSYIPIMIAAGATKEMLIPGDEPPWMKGGLDSYLAYGFERAGLFGVPQLYMENVYGTHGFGDFDLAKQFGPSVDQAQDFISAPFLERKTVGGELFGALPAGNQFRRLVN